MISYKTYSKFFSEVIDTFVVLASGIMKKGQGGSQKGMVITGKDIGRSQKMFRVYSMIYPFVRLFAKLDSILFFTSGYMLIAKAKIRKGKMV